MNNKSKNLRDNARFLVFLNISKALTAYFLSGIISTLITYNMQVTIISKNLFYEVTPQLLAIQFLITFLALIVNLPLSFCAQRFYLSIARNSASQPLFLRDFFTPFANPKLLVKGAFLVFLTSILNVLGIFVLIFPVYLAFSMAVFFLSDNPEISVFEALKRSAKLMKGKKWFAFKTVIPLFAVYILFNLLFASLYFISFIVTAVIEVMITVTLALIYDEGTKVSSQM